jgi:hypothetical protein
MSPEQETLEKIKFVLQCNNDAQAIRILEQFSFYYKEQKDEHAINFYEWRSTTPIKNIDQYTNKEALEIYKKEKGL